ncbi:S-layer homology domain-containing protein [Lawsonibacter asaccharolyticus]|uniref:S-layer homology domain-containing protein n=1 Tax=Lawsonibacter asaccharolyticus TaxID=2108523 RepID=UPI00265930E8|nr:S-layer homology domain-containing protein [Lawsonibacter asaccharolyticus]UMM47225.1 S-layer homology domain-containing protein [Lawsonibacter asaccharolyticus]
MRNLKRALSLALASVMLLGMMVVGSSAKGIDDFTDKAEIVNQDAVAVTSAIGMFEGYEDGSFGPENVVTRAEMAVIICTMLYGAGVNVNQFAETNVFTDVPAWAEGYVNLCSSLGIVAGVGDGKFDPNATVTTAQAVLMLCRALGYFQNAADFGDNWMLAATAKGTALGLYGDLKLTAEAGLTRDNVAELVFNALTKAVPVQYNELLGVYYNENKGILYSLTYYYTDTLGYKNFDLVYKTNENTDYGRPGTTWGIGSYRMDGSPSGEGNKEGVLNEDGSLIPERVKMTSDDEIITVADTPDFTYTANTKENVIYKAVGKSVVDDYAWNIYVDGAEQAGDDLAPANDKDTDYTYTAKGATTEIYVDDVNETVTVVMINYYMAEVTKVKDGENTVRVLSNATKTSPIDERTIAANGFAVDDYVVITVDVDDDGDSFVASIDAPATAEGSVSYVSKLSEAEGNKDGQYAKLDDGNKYTYSKYTASDLDDINMEHPTLDVNYRLYLDPNGYVLGFLALDNYYENYLYVESAASYLNSIDAKVIFTDGTEKQVKIDDEFIDGSKIDVDNVKNDYDASSNPGLVGRAYAYTESDGVYTLRPVWPSMSDTGRPGTPAKDYYKNYRDVSVDVTVNYAAGTPGETAAQVNAKNTVIKSGAAYITANGTTYIVDKDTKFVDVDENQVYTGFENVPDYIADSTVDGGKVSFWAIDTRSTDGVAEVIFIYEGEASNSNDVYFYSATGSFETHSRNENYKTHDVYVDGEKQTMNFTPAGHKDQNGDEVGLGLYRVNKTDGKGFVTDITKITSFENVVSVGGNSFSLGTSAPKQYITDKDTVIVVATYDRKDNGSLKDPVVSLGSLKDMNVAKDKNGNIIDDYNTVVYVANTSDSGRIADLVYIVKTEKAVYDNTVTFTNYAGGTYTLAVQSTNAQDNGDGTVGINDNQTLKFKITPKTVGTTTYELVSVKLGDEVLTADTNDVYSVKVGTKDLTIDVTTKAQVVGKGDVSMDPAGNITVTWKNGVTNKPGPDEAVENVKTFLKMTAGWKGDITVTKQGVNYVFTGKDSYGWDAQATWDTANNFYEARTFTLNGAEVTKNVAETLSAADTNHYLIQKADAADDYALSSAATVGDLTDGAIVSTQGRKVTVTNAAGTATDVYVDNDTYTVPEEGNWYKVGASPEASYASSKTITLSTKDTAVQTGLIKVDSNYKKIGEKVSVTTDGGSTYYQIDRNGTKTYDVYANEYTVTAGADVTITKGFIKVTVEKDGDAGNLINTIDGSATAEKFVSKTGGNVEVTIVTNSIAQGSFTLTDENSATSAVSPSAPVFNSMGEQTVPVTLTVSASATDVTVSLKLV